MWKYVSFKITIIFMSTFAHARLPVADMDNHTRKVQVGDLVFPVFDQGEGKWRYEKITAASHWLMLDKPNEVNKLLLEFLGNGR